MGALHEGHLSLIRLAREQAEMVVVSLFVNPTQFGEGEDFTVYPRCEEVDRVLCEREGAAVLFMPDARAVYAKDASVWVDEEQLSMGLCGASRPGHFRGVCTVVLKLFNCVQPELAFFGEKDAQQVRIVERMVRDLNVPVEVVRGATVREADGLAMSSRNARLSVRERAVAPGIYKALQLAVQRANTGERSAGVLVDEVRAALARLEGVVVDYVVLVDDVNLAEVTCVERPALLAVAVWLGEVRLIDHCVLDVR
jgi:pantoate--beta-alanine ligase